MSKKIHIKITSLFVFLLCICAGCSAGRERTDTLEELDRLAEIKVFSAENEEPVKTINEEEQLYQYHQYSMCFEASDTEEHQEELEKELEGAREQYELVSYRYPAARFGKKELEESVTLTLYENTNVIKMTVAEGNIKGFSVPEEFLTFYYELSDDEIAFFRSLAET